MPLDLSKYLSVDVESIPKSIPSLPLGHYFASIKSWKGAERDYDKASGGPKTPVVELTFKITGASDDVEFGDGFAEGSEVNKTVTKDYSLNDPDSTGQVMLRRLAEETCKLPVQGLQLSDLLPMLIDQEVLVYNEPRPGKEEGQFFANIKKVLPVDAEVQ
jgi:hypothetical protein